MSPSKAIKAAFRNGSAAAEHCLNIRRRNVLHVFRHFFEARG
ncbi:hypothetical protein ACWGRJ_47080 [Bradyrhizobium sp. Lot11]